MELTYQNPNALQFPSHYCPLTEEEMTYEGGGIVVEFHPEVLGQWLTNLAVNVVYVISAGAFSAVIDGAVRGYRDGLSPIQTLTHFWGRQNTAGKVASVFVGALAGGYAVMQVYQIYTTVKDIYDAVTNPDPAQPQAAAAAA